MDIYFARGIRWRPAQTTLSDVRKRSNDSGESVIFSSKRWRRRAKLIRHRVGAKKTNYYLIKRTNSRRG